MKVLKWDADEFINNNIFIIIITSIYNNINNNIIILFISNIVIFISVFIININS